MTLPDTMSGVVLLGHGGPEMLQGRDDLPVPRPAPGEVLVRVGAAAVNNTDINTRVGWYARAVRGATDGAGAGTVEAGGWSGALRFPRVQGADGCGRIAAVGEGVDLDRIGERVVLRPMHQPLGDPDPMALHTLGSERDGTFAEYVAAPARDAYAVRSDMTDAELASFPCSYSTAEGMLARAELAQGERVLVTGASGGVGAAAVQLAALRGAEVVAVSSPAKADAVRALGATEVVGRDAALPEGGFDCVIDLVGGARWPLLLDALRRGGRLATAGAIAGPVVELDLRTLYLRDLTLLGCTHQPPEVFAALVAHIESGRLAPVVARTFPLREIAAAQEAFAAKAHVGKIALRVAD
ncbi:zinc-binding dehydrogenase [Jannaschia sp. W003]|uniref:zinc-binding dehydrogenase n=1 Tax=Jannaschia sp. W003 TaxID=2867012 RepID=UPI0021A8927C|nr:zinc-binding dehydrogenase [Jannaschia sp. W003]UWQ20224.1 zinc-binding dehydrogenase [Jannaschia sp. W003]